MESAARSANQRIRLVFTFPPVMLVDGVLTPIPPRFKHTRLEGDAGSCRKLADLCRLG
jgi:hypothetical protein